MSKKHITVVRITPRVYPTNVGSGPAKHAFFASKYSSNSKIKLINIASKPHLHISNLKNNIKQISPDFEIHYLPLYSIKLSENSIYAQLTFFLWFNILTIVELFKINPMNRILIIVIIVANMLMVGCTDNQKRKDQKTPNLVFVMADQYRASAMGFLDKEPVITPNLDRFANEGLVFSNATSTFPICSPYRAMLFTGNYYTKNRGTAKSPAYIY